MTEFEINKAVAEHLKLNVIAYERIEIVLFDDMDATPFDPCNNVEQAWEIMMKYNICVTKDGDGYTAVRDLKYMDNNEFSSEFNAPVYHGSPLASAMLCFLEMDK